MPIFPFLPLILMRGIMDVSAQMLAPRDDTPRPQAPKRATPPPFDELWLGASNPERR
jgi:hypothetical protein